MSREQLLELSQENVEIGVHSYAHCSYENLSLEEIEEDVSLACANLSDIPYLPVFAYPYGKLPTDRNTCRAMKEIFQKYKFIFALRIGNRQNVMPFKDPFELQRLDINGNYRLWQFALKLRWGKCPLL